MRTRVKKPPTKAVEAAKRYKKIIEAQPKEPSFTLINIVDHISGQSKGWYNEATGKLVVQGEKFCEYELFKNLEISVKFLDITTEESSKAVGEELPIKFSTLKKRLDKVK